MRSASEILDEIRRLKGLDSDTALGTLFGVKQSTVASWRSRNSLPYELIIAFCVKEGVSTDDLFLGAAAAARAGPDPISEKVVLMLQEMSEEKRREVLRYAEEKKLLAELLAAREEGRKKAD